MSASTDERLPDLAPAVPAEVSEPSPTPVNDGYVGIPEHLLTVSADSPKWREWLDTSFAEQHGTTYMDVLDKDPNAIDPESRRRITSAEYAATRAAEVLAGFDEQPTNQELVQPATTARPNSTDSMTEPQVEILSSTTIPRPRRTATFIAVARAARRYVTSRPEAPIRTDPDEWGSAEWRQAGYELDNLLTPQQVAALEAQAAQIVAAKSSSLAVTETRAPDAIGLELAAMRAEMVTQPMNRRQQVARFAGAVIVGAREAVAALRFRSSGQVVYGERLGEIHGAPRERVPVDSPARTVPRAPEARPSREALADNVLNLVALATGLNVNIFDGVEPGLVEAALGALDLATVHPDQLGVVLAAVADELAVRSVAGIPTGVNAVDRARIRRAGQPFVGELRRLRAQQEEQLAGLLRVSNRDLQAALQAVREGADVDVLDALTREPLMRRVVTAIGRQNAIMGRAVNALGELGDRIPRRRLRVAAAAGVLALTMSGVAAAAATGFTTATSVANGQVPQPAVSAPATPANADGPTMGHHYAEPRVSTPSTTPSVHAAGRHDHGNTAQESSTYHGRHRIPELSTRPHAHLNPADILLPIAATIPAISETRERLGEGGTIWGAVGDYLGEHGLSTSDKSVLDLTQSTLKDNHLTWTKAHDLPVHYSFVIPGSLEDQKATRVPAHVTR